MKKYILLFLILPLWIFFAEKSFQRGNGGPKFQKALNAEYLDPKETPLRGDNFKNFKEHPFFRLI